MRKRLWVVLATMLAAAASAASCTASVAVGDRPCPCAEGWTCCPGANVCVASGLAACPQTAEAGSPASEGGSEGGPIADSGAPDVASGTVPSGPLPPGVLANGQSARCLAVDYFHGHVVWQNADGRVWASELTGGPTLWVSTAPPQVANVGKCAMRVDSDALYVADTEAGKLLRLELKTSTGAWGFGSWTTLGTFTTPSSFVYDTTSIYVTEYDAGRITKLPKSGLDGGAAVVLKDGLLHPDDIGLDWHGLVWIDRGSDPDGGSADGVIDRMATAGGAVTTVVGPQSGLDSLVGGAGSFYWLDATGVHGMPDDGGAPTTLASVSGAHSLVSTGARLFWIAPAGLQTGSADSSFPTSPATLPPDVTGVTLLAADNLHVFWVSADLIRFYSLN